MTLVKDVDDQVFILRLPNSSTDNPSTSLFREQTTIRGLLQRHEDMHGLVEDNMSAQLNYQNQLTAHRNGPFRKGN